jgi:hypothetical protein
MNARGQSRVVHSVGSNDRKGSIVLKNPTAGRLGVLSMMVEVKVEEGRASSGGHLPRRRARSQFMSTWRFAAGSA